MMASSFDTFESQSSTLTSGSSTISTSFSGSQGFLGQDPNSLTNQSNDPNSAELFKLNMQAAQEQIMALKNAARTALSGIQNAYHPGSNPTQTETDIVTVKQNLHIVMDFLRVSGVGALPVIPISEPSPPTIPEEQKLMEQTSHSVKYVFEMLKRYQDSAGTVVNLLSTPAAPIRS